MQEVGATNLYTNISWEIAPQTTIEALNIKQNSRPDVPWKLDLNDKVATLKIWQGWAS
jgi:hypothetical protein